MTLQHRLILAYSGAFSIILIIFGVVVMLYNANLAEGKNYIDGERFVETNILLLDHYFYQLRTISNVIAKDDDIISAVNYRNRVENIDYTIELYNQWNVADKVRQLSLLSFITNAVIIGADYKPLYYYGYGMSPVKDFDFSACDWFTSLQFSGYDAFFTHVHSTEYLIKPTSKETVSLITAIRDAKQYIGGTLSYLMCDFNLDSILAHGDGESQVQMAIYDGTKLVYFQNVNMLSERQRLIFLDRLNSGEESFRLTAKDSSESDYLVFSKLSNASGWRIIGLVTMEDNQKPIIYFAVAMIVFAIATTVILSVVLSKSMLLPLNVLVKKYKQVGEGNFDVTFGKTGMVELDQLAQTSQQMVENISRLNKDIVDEQKKLAKEQIKALQHQINPHFLNNVLQSIKAMAVCGDVESISTISTLLGKVLSYAVYKDLWNGFRIEDRRTC